MIASTTELLNELLELNNDEKLSAGKRIPVAERRCHLSEEHQKQIRKEFAIHYDCVQTWFIRCSRLEKIKWLMKLMQELRTLDSFSLIMNTMKFTASKCRNYGQSQIYTNYLYDRVVQDHNRTMYEKVLKDVENEDLEWFRTLEDFEQILIIIGLLRMGGGSVIYEVFTQSQPLYFQRVDQRTQQAANSKEAASYRKLTFTDTTTGLPSRNIDIKPSSPDAGYDPKDPLVIELQKQRKIWSDALNKYRIQVEGKPPSPKKDDKKGGKKGGKGDKSPKADKSKDKGKGKGKGKGKSKGEEEKLDYIQILPVWVVKKIFSYVDAKTLKKVKAVNNYWNYVITDLQKEEKARKGLNKFIKKMEASVGATEMLLGEHQKLIKDVYATTSNKRLIKLNNRGATIPQLHPKFKQPMTSKCLPTEAASMMPENYVLPFHHVAGFPRLAMRAAPLYKVSGCMVNELGITFVDAEEELHISPSSRGNSPAS